MSLLRNIKNIENFEPLDENMTVYTDSDAYGGNSIFKIKIRPLGDLSGRKGKGEKEPVGEFQEGDVVRGIGMDDQQEHQGAVVSIKYDDDSEEVLDITVEEDGKLVALVASTIDMVKDNGADNAHVGAAGDPIDTNLPTVTQYTYENLTRWEDFII